jgi:uncharacterized membrane protein YphA (DoxX/SURF4 family)
METVIRQGRILFAIAIIAFGAENLICARFGQPVVPVLPWVPGNPWLGDLMGSVLLVLGLSIVANFRTRLAATLLGVLLLLSVLILWISRVAASPLDLGLRTRGFETLAMCGAAFTLAGGLPAESLNRAWDSAMNKLIGSGPYLFAASAVVFGIDHFLLLNFIASLVPAWIPGPLFWAYFTGAAFIVAGACIATGWMARWAAFWLGMMFLLWFLLLHGPRVMGAPHSQDPNEWSSAFIALGMCGGSWIIAQHPRKRSDQDENG